MLGTVDNGDRCAPVALATDQPVSQTVVYHLLANTFFFDIPNNFCNCSVSRCAIEGTRIDHYPQCLFRLCPSCRITRLLALWTDDLANWKTELASKFEVALIMGRHTHNCT